MVPPNPILVPQRTGGGLFAPEHYRFKKLFVHHTSGTSARRPSGLAEKYMEHAKSIFHTDHSVFDGNEEVCVTAHLVGRALATSPSQAGKFLTLRMELGHETVLPNGKKTRNLNLDGPDNLFRVDPTSHTLFDGKSGKPADASWGFLPVHWMSTADEVNKRDGRTLDEITPGDVFPFYIVTLDNAKITRAVYEVQDPFSPSESSSSASPPAEGESQTASSAQHQLDGSISDEGAEHDLGPQGASSTQHHSDDSIVHEGAGHHVGDSTHESSTRSRDASATSTKRPRTRALHTVQGIDTSRIVWCTCNPILAEYEILGKLLARREKKSTWPAYQNTLYEYLQPRIGHLHNDALELSMDAPRKLRDRGTESGKRNATTAPTRCGKPPPSPPTTRSKTKARTVATARTVDNDGPGTRSKTVLFPDSAHAQGNAATTPAPPTRAKKSKPIGTRSATRSQKAPDAGPSKPAASASRRRDPGPTKPTAPARVISQKSTTQAEQTQDKKDKKNKKGKKVMFAELANHDQ
ncbi:hypothetical protein EV121DRAFT_288927 [Schizophyllum commune]